MFEKILRKSMKRTAGSLFLLLVFISSCSQKAASLSPELTSTPTLSPAIYTDPSYPIEERVDDLLMRMTLDEKIGQMTQPDISSLHPGDVKTYMLGSVLSGGSDNPASNTPQGWQDMVTRLQTEALSTRLKIPIIYGIDATHGNAHLYGATVFPQESGVAATHDPALAQKIGEATAEEMLATGIPWTFSPIVAVPQDIRWGRTDESYSEDTQLTTELSSAYIKGLQTLPENIQASTGQSLFTLATAKHYIGDGGTIWGSSRTGNYMLDQGNVQIDEATLRTLYLPPYKAAVEAGVMSVMASFSSWRTTKMHAQRYLLTDVLKNELGFEGFIVSDWAGIDQVDPDYYTAVVSSINAGIDMAMVPTENSGGDLHSNYSIFIDTMKQAIENNDISEDRINDAVRRILRVKFMLGLFEHPYPDPSFKQTVRSDEHIAIARQAVQESLVLLKNDNAALPIPKTTQRIFVAGQGADDIGMMCGGWTITWQGETGSIQPGTTILEAIHSIVSPDTAIVYNQDGKFIDRANIGIVVVGEKPYAEGFGDQANLELSTSDVNIINSVRPNVDKLVVVILSGRPLVITDQLGTADAWVEAWLPGTEGEGISDVLFGDRPFVGRLPYTWPRSNEQLPINENNSMGKTGCDAPLFPFGYGLGDAGSQPITQPVCPSAE
jgi:beta-glucosidase